MLTSQISKTWTEQLVVGNSEGWDIVVRVFSRMLDGFYVEGGVVSGIVHSLLLINCPGAGLHPFGRQSLCAGVLRLLWSTSASRSPPPLFALCGDLCDRILTRGGDSLSSSLRSGAAALRSDFLAKTRYLTAAPPNP